MGAGSGEGRIGEGRTSVIFWTGLDRTGGLADWRSGEVRSGERRSRAVAQWRSGEGRSGAVAKGAAAEGAATHLTAIEFRLFPGQAGTFG
jgi:hypothetical protein